MEKTEEKKTSYTLFWSGEEISTDYLSKYYENELDDIKEENILLGEFDKNGKYTFTQEVKKGLVAIKKRVDEKNDNSYFLIAKTNKNAFTFKMKIFEIEGRDLYAANLYIIEVVDDERFLKPLKTFVAQFVDKKNDEFVNKAKYAFNIVVEGEFNELEKKANENIIEPILPKPREKNQAFLDIAIEVLLEELLEELEKCGETGKKIKEEFEKETGYTASKEGVKKGEIPKPNYNSLKKKLDIIVEKNKGYEQLIALNPNLEKAFQKFNQAVANERATSRQVEIMPEDYKKLNEEAKGEKKEEKKDTKAPAKGGAKPAAKKAAGGGGKSSGGGGGGKKGGKKGGGGGGKKDKKKDKKADPAWKGAVMPILKEPSPVVLPKKEATDEVKKLHPNREDRPEPIKTPMPDKRVIPSNGRKKVFDGFLDEDDFSDDLNEMLKFSKGDKVEGKDLDALDELDKDKGLTPETIVKPVELEEKTVKFDFEDLEVLQRRTVVAPRNDERTIR